MQCVAPGRGWIPVKCPTDPCEWRQRRPELCAGPGGADSHLDSNDAATPCVGYSAQPDWTLTMYRTSARNVETGHRLRNRRPAPTTLLPVTIYVGVRELHGCQPFHVFHAIASRD